MADSRDHLLDETVDDIKRALGPDLSQQESGHGVASEEDVTELFPPSGSSFNHRSSSILDAEEVRISFVEILARYYCS